MKRFTLIFTVATICCWNACEVFAEDQTKISPEQLEFFESKIRPIFVEHCYECHSAKSGDDLEGGLLLDSRQGWSEGGDSGPAVVPGKVDKSLVVHAVRYEEDLVSAMPPKSKLPDEQIKAIEKWVQMGAPDPRSQTSTAKPMVETFDLQKRFEEHWSWRAITRPATPEVEKTDWVQNEVDRFVLAKLEAVGLQPAIPAAKEIWIRRVYFDLIGLPPTVEQVDAFLADESDQAHEKVVDQLLRSKHFGEKWARHWMDLVRYAETYGHEFDYPIEHASEYRDYLIRAFNEDVPYDQFVVEHIAGDMMTNPRRHPIEGFNESIIGTGFWYFHEATHAPTDVLKNEADITDNQIDVFGKSFLGLTIACARCHDHKFDAISTADYYSLTAYIQSSCRQIHPLDPERKIEASVGELEAQRKAYATLLAKRSEQSAVSAVHNPADYFRAAKDLFAQAKQSPPPELPEEVFEDFESGFDGWTTQGKAFGDQPQKDPIRPQREIKGRIGSAFAGSFGGTDRGTGSLVSKPFTITRPYINLLVGGGKKNTYVELVVDGKPQGRFSGENREDLIQRSWDVRAFIGKQATISIVDNHKGGWGHINVDQIVFADQVPGKKNSNFIRPTDEMISSMATQRGLDLDRLSVWIQHLFAAKPDPGSQDPISLLAFHLLDTNAEAKITERQNAAEAKRAEYAKDNDLIVDFDGESLPDGWTTSGYAFQPVSKRIGDGFVPIRDQLLPRSGTIDSAVYGRRASGILRSPTFEITKKNIHVLMRSTANVQMRIIIDNYQMAHFNGLLFRGTDNRGGSMDTKQQWAWRSLSGDLRKYVGHNAYLEFVDMRDETIAIDEIWMSDGGAPPIPKTEVLVACASGANGLDQAWAETEKSASGQRSEVANWMIDKGLLTLDQLLGDSEVGEIVDKATHVAAAMTHPRFAIAMAEGTAENAHVYVRGNPAMLGEKVVRRDLAALGGDQTNRLGLAKRIASLDNPLTARVIVNRIWHHLFGRGIVPSVDDFGPQGQPPSHPELLDALAVRFAEDGWSIKSAIRNMVLSSTYRQASVVNPANDSESISSIDPTNSLLHRMRVRRLPGESIRDAILAISGRLDTKQFGPSIATHRTEFMTGRGARGSGPLDGAGRRSVYLSIYRNFLNPFLMAFDMPSPFGPKGRRSNSNVPAQALTLMNDPFVIEQSKIWARSSAAEQDPDSRIRMMVRAAHAIDPNEDMLGELKDFVQSSPGGVQSQKGWNDLAHGLFNMKAFYFLR